MSGAQREGIIRSLSTTTNPQAVRHLEERLAQTETTEGTEGLSEETARLLGTTARIATLLDRRAQLIRRHQVIVGPPSARTSVERLLRRNARELAALGHEVPRV